MTELKALNDEDLMLAYRQGDAEAFAELYRRHGGRVYGFLRKKIYDPQLIDDVFQAAFLKLHASRDLYDPQYPFLPWLFTLTRNVLTDALRRRQRQREDSLEDHLEMPQVVEASFDGSESVNSALAELPSQQREALRFRYDEDLTFEEIARRLDTTPANVRQIVSRAIRRLREVLGNGAGRGT